jgi:RNA polymerase sigma factor (sigma-70 family)
MQSVNNDFFQEAINNEYYKKILYKVCNKNLKNVCTKDEIQSIAMDTLWNCIKKYKINDKTKFSSYLYKSIQNNSKRLLSKKIKQSKEKPLVDNIHSQLSYDMSAYFEAKEILESLKEVDKVSYDILIQKFYYGMTHKEIGDINGYTKEAARKKIKKALDQCRKIVYK